MNVREVTIHATDGLFFYIAKVTLKRKSHVE